MELFHGDEKEVLPIPANILQNVEVLDTEGLEKLLLAFFSRIKLKKQKVVLSLADDLVFDKQVVADSKADLVDKFKKFLATLPLSKEKIIGKKIVDKDKIYFLATNKRIFEEVSTVLINLGWEVMAIVPINLFKDKLGLETELTTMAAKKIVSNKDLIKISDFLKEEDQSENREGNSGSKLVIILVILLLVAVGLVLLAFRFGIWEFNYFLKKESPSKVITTQPEESTESAEPAESPSAALSKEELKIQVLNGSGLAGQAGKVKDQLIELGYSDSNIETGNATGSGETVVIFSKKVPEEVKEEIISELGNIFDKVTTQEGIKDSEFDIIITTGKTTSP